MDLKRKIAVFSLLLIVMAFIPAIIVCRDNQCFDSTADNSNDEIIALAAELCEDDFCDEAVKAMVILANTDYPTVKASDNNSDNEYYLLAKHYYNSNRELYIQKGGSKMYIPYAESSNGATVSNEKYPYLIPTASPWDCLDPDYEKNSVCAGVSLRGVDYLCRRGFSAEEALLHYLTGFEIKA